MFINLFSALNPHHDEVTLTMLQLVYVILRVQPLIVARRSGKV